ncbi:adaptor protein MecA [Fundicoccus culcitae]|uniref:Adaptor protein MecA n=1 Tax=Fundicoccus culcitae TaxID=2969821 RepID=A0ABY5P6I0_9LACT|nr:adaptor protein MecA [Fundicoccus culcitae]UUX34154.1 adaptor protein MecA [Fundicoccus culcitae]
MEMEHINENLIKVMIGMDDLEERGIDFLDLIGDQNSIEQFFYSILDEVDVDNHFHDSEAVTFQVMPNSEGLELYISRTNFDEMDAFWEDELSNRLREHRKQTRKGRSPKSKEKEIMNHSIDKNQSNEKTSTHVDKKRYNNINQIVRFQTLEDFLSLAREIPIDNIQTNLYHMHQSYYLVIKSINEQLDEKLAYSYILKMLEFGEPYSTTENVLMEHGELIREADALKFFGENI